MIFGYFMVEEIDGRFTKERFSRGGLGGLLGESSLVCYYVDNVGFLG